MEATEPSTFAVIFIGKNNNFLLDFKCENAIGEQLAGIQNKNQTESEDPHACYKGIIVK